MEGHLGVILKEDFFWQGNAQSLFAIAQRQRHFAMMSLTSTVCHIGCDHKVVEHGIAGLWQFEWHTHIEGAIIVSHYLIAQNLIALATIVQGSSIPIATITPPPKSSTTRYLIFYLGTLHRHTGIRQGLTLHSEGVASLISLLHFREVYMERGTLVFLYAERVALVVCTEGESSRES